MAGLDFCSSGGTAGSPQGGRFCLVAFAWRALDGIPLPAATTRSPDGIPCEAPLYVVLNQPSRRRSDPWRFVLGRWVLDGCWVLGGRPLGVGCWVAVGCWVLQGGDDEVSRRDTLLGASRRSLEAPLTLASRSVGVHFLGVGCWVLGVGWPLGVGCAAGSPPGGQVDDEVTSPGSRRLA